MKLANDVTVKFSCDEYKVEKVIVQQGQIPFHETALVFHRANLRRGSSFTTEIKYGSKTIEALGGDVPKDWANALEWLIDIYSSTDKKVARNIPFIGKFIEGLLPDARWHFDLWYDFHVTSSGLLRYRLHFGPTSNIDVRAKLEGEYQLINNE